MQHANPCWPRKRVAEVAAAAEQREAKEEGTRARLARGELGLDIYAMRDKLAAAGLRYVDAAATRSVTQAF